MRDNRIPTPTSPTSVDSAESRPRPYEHLVQFYEGDDALITSLNEFVATGLRRAEGVVAIATRAHCLHLDAHLRTTDIDLGAARSSGQLVELDAASALAQVLVDGQPDAARFLEAVGPTISQTANGRPALRVFGEMVALLAAQGEQAAAVEVEALWNDLQQREGFSLMCAYPMQTLDGAAAATPFGAICAAHTRVIPTESYTELETADEHTREIARLQQRAASLEAELAAREQLQMEALRLAAIVESSDDAIIGKTLEGVVVAWNAGAERLYGYSASEMVGRPISSIMPEDQPDELPSIMERLSRGERIEHYETERVTRDGRRVDVSVSISPIRNVAGQLVGASAIARDISERKRHEQKQQELLARERQSRENAEAALHARDEFLSVAAHELRTPLATLKGFAQLASRRLARGGRLDPEQIQESLDAITAHSDKLARLLSQLLDVSRLELGKLVLELQPTDLVELAEGAVNDTLARATEHTITFRVASDMTATNVDRLRLEQVLMNLLDNAIKYSPEDEPIEVSLGRAEDGSLEIGVRDHGPGIQPDKRAHIFERFYQAHGNGHKSGMGVGLYVSQHIVQLHGGDIRAEFPADGGSCFVVRLPVA